MNRTPALQALVLAAICQRRRQIAITYTDALGEGRGFAVIRSLRTDFPSHYRIVNFADMQVARFSYDPVEKRFKLVSSTDEFASCLIEALRCSYPLTAFNLVEVSV